MRRSFTVLSGATVGFACMILPLAVASQGVLVCHQTVPGLAAHGVTSLSLAPLDRAPAAMSRYDNKIDGG